MPSPYPVPRPDRSSPLPPQGILPRPPIWKCHLTLSRDPTAPLPSSRKANYFPLDLRTWLTYIKRKQTGTGLDRFFVTRLPTVTDKGGSTKTSGCKIFRLTISGVKRRGVLLPKQVVNLVRHSLRFGKVKTGSKPRFVFSLKPR